MHTISRGKPFGRRGERRQPETASFGAPLVAAMTRAFDILLTWQARGRQRRALAELDDRMLHDLGLGRADVERELRKAIWRA